MFWRCSCPKFLQYQLWIPWQFAKIYHFSDISGFWKKIKLPLIILPYQSRLKLCFVPISHMTWKLNRANKNLQSQMCKPLLPYSSASEVAISREVYSVVSAHIMIPELRRYPFSRFWHDKRCRHFRIRIKSWLIRRWIITFHVAVVLFV